MKNPETANALPTEELLRHVGWLQGLARSLVLDDGEADDAVQETWLSVLSVTGAVRQPRAWLAGTLRNKVLGHRRSEGRRREHEARAADASSSHVSNASLSLQVLERQRALIDHVEALPETQRTAILARYYEGLAPREIARREGLRVETVKDRLKRGLQSLRRELDREHGDRAAWAGWLLPLAVETKQKAAMGAITFAASVLLTVGVGAMLLGALRNEVQPQSETEVAAASELDEAAGATEEPESITAPNRQESRVALSSAPVGTSFLILEKGAPVPHAAVALLSVESVGKL
ncbi:MAG: RNA polymerase sigma factor, partial [Planctomycetota bacterium]